ncbi:hypothetical protein J2D73_16720 [Acetobacter sacchari]|uniref:Helix-turn-helix domain-containing protein n=1 Tax=Acetobacter sacchari TaxID=2661687 RepID=A0ABS3LZW0_9PROT|nr:hypothetical protein [Acetobacter sacchari]MBO1361430.1 hypothetical protein [Acetobacter sacchari]
MARNKTIPNTYTVKEVSDITGYSESTIRRQIGAGQLWAVNINGLKFEDITAGERFVMGCWAQDAHVHFLSLFFSAARASEHPRTGGERKEIDNAISVAVRSYKRRFRAATLRNTSRPFPECLIWLLESFVWKIYAPEERRDELTSLADQVVEDLQCLGDIPIHVIADVRHRCYRAIAEYFEVAA